jgi:hypothetical protein
MADTEKPIGERINAAAEGFIDTTTQAGRDAVAKSGADSAAQRLAAGVGNLRYPADLGGNTPFIQFMTQRAQYNVSGSGVSVTPTGDSVTLYIPTNISVSDSLRYDSVSTGVVGAVMEKGVQNINGEDIAAIAFNNAEAIAGVAGLKIGSKAAGEIGAIAGVGGLASVVGNIKSEISKTRQRVMNPREFMLFRAPSIRQFGYNFTFIPKSVQEARSIPSIIRFFRQAAYPTLHSRGIDYVFPDAFSITFGKTSSMIKVPEVVCVAVNVTYNPNSVSFYRYDNMPVEITMQLSFQELKPIDQSLVAQGY